MENNLSMAKDFVDNNNFEKSYEVLKSIQEKCETWYYLNSITSFNLGYYKEANDSVKKLISLNPENEKYQKLKDSFNFYKQNYNNRSNSYRSSRGATDNCCCCDCEDCCCCCCDCKDWCCNPCDCGKVCYECCEICNDCCFCSCLDDIVTIIIGFIILMMIFAS